ncbi:methyltransferase TYW3-domain-containing protein [Hypoxylon sp. NC1633]|nr:methyltransferase TYW3-domain-containing protein [Hypoxylon sp. NC1633]
MKSQVPPPPPSFTARKERILQQLAVPDAEYTDASPKGTVDVGIRHLIDGINATDGFVTTSSCAGRVSVFCEGSKKAGATTTSSTSAEKSGGNKEAGGEGGEGAVEEGRGDAEGRKLAGVGGKGGGGVWLFVSHDPVPLDDTDGHGGDIEELLGLKNSLTVESSTAQEGLGDHAIPDLSATRLVHFKFEPMILHVLTASPEHAQLLLRCGLQAGFRESGAVSLTAPAGEQHATPMVAIRSMGLAFESLIGYRSGDGKMQCTVSPSYLRTLVRIANERFSENKKRIDRFSEAFVEATRPSGKDNIEDGWQDAQARRERKKAEGLKRKAQLQSQSPSQSQKQDDDMALYITPNEDLT